MTPKVTIVTSVLNCRDTITDTIESVVTQSYPNIEHVIADGGSTDGTVEIIRRYAEQYPDRVRWDSKVDGGIYEGMNRGLAMATGDVIGFLNGDDYLSAKSVIRALIDEMYLRGLDAVYGDVRYISRKDRARSVRYYSSASFRPERMLKGYMPAHPSFYARREAYERFGNYDTSYRLAADFEIMLRMIYMGGITTGYLPMECAVVRAGGASNASLSSYMRIFREHLRAYKKHNLPSGAFKDASRYFNKIIEFLHKRKSH